MPVGERSLHACRWELGLNHIDPIAVYPVDFFDFAQRHIIRAFTFASPK